MTTGKLISSFLHSVSLRGVLAAVAFVWSGALPVTLNAQEGGATGHHGGALRPGDSLEVRISGVPQEEIGQFTGQYIVDEQGSISLPYIGSVKGAGLLANQLQTVIENRLKSQKIYTHPTITVLVHNMARFVNVRGAVRAPSRVPYTPDLTIMTAINAVGGFSEFGGRRLRLVRDGKTMEINVKDIVRDPQKDIPVKPGDQIEALQSIF